ncbi:MAG: hypothetical protein KDK06_15580 [Gammaproteobacteria bacterium]|nr:hypothetical protein [Gammaproteobacteria bacterium]
MPHLMLPFVLLMLLAAGWLVVMARLLLRLVEHEPKIYAALGRPVLRVLYWEIPDEERHARGLQAAVVRSDGEHRARRRDYTPEELRRVSNLLEFIAVGRFRMMHDAEARRLAEWLRTILALFPLGLAGFLVFATRSPV